MTEAYILIWSSWLLFGVSAVWALAWAINHGEFSDTEAAALSVLDDDELPTDQNEKE